MQTLSDESGRTFWQSKPRKPVGKNDLSSPPRPWNLLALVKGPKLPARGSLRLEEWVARRVQHAEAALRESVDWDAETWGGILVIRGTRLPVARVFAEIGDDLKLSEIADDLDLDRDSLVKLFEGLAILFERPVRKT